MPELYIADGHHRSSSSALLSDDLDAAETPGEAHKYFMTYIIPESHLRIHSFSRMITDLCGMDKDMFLIKLDSILKLKTAERNIFSLQKCITSVCISKGTFTL